MCQIAKIIILMCGFIVLTFAQIPFFGRCPEFEAMPNFNHKRFLGMWYEVERYFTLTEVVAKCIVVWYEQREDGNIYVNNFYTNRM